MVKGLKVSAFALVAIVVLFGAELGQAVAEGFLNAEEDQMHALVNQTRTQRGLARLPNNDQLKTMARRQAQNMAAKGYIYHTPDLGPTAKSLQINYALLGENVGVGPSVAAVEDAFLASPGHLENIVEPAFNALGVGATAGGGSLYFSQNYAKLRASAPVPAAVTQPQPAAAAAAARAAVSRPRPVAASPPAAPPVVVPTPRATPVPVEQMLRTVPRSLEHYATMAGAPVGPVLAPAAGSAAGDERAAMTATVGWVFVRFFETLAFWK